jgi:tRNA U55 pseudouridine synthase TruB
MQEIEQTPPSASAVKRAIPADAEAKAEDVVKAKDAGKAEATMSDIDRLVSDMVANVTVETNMATAEIMATVADEGKEIDNTPLDKRYFDLRHLGG